MKTVLLRFTVNGVKNIQNKISIDFYNKTIYKNKNIELKNKNIKAIFGINGAGKTAFIQGIDIYNKINLKSDYLLQDNIKKVLTKIINKRVGHIYLESIFSLSNEEGNNVNNVYKHIITIRENKDLINTFYTIEEELLQLKSLNIDGEYKRLYSVKNGNLNIENSNYKDLEQIKTNLINKLDNSTVISYGLNLLRNMINGNADLSYDNDFLIFKIVDCLSFVLSLKVYLDVDDKYSELINNNSAIYDSLINSKYSDVLKNSSIIFSLNEDLIAPDRLDDYKRDIDKMKNFIQILKPNLIDIKLDQSFDGTFHHIKKIFVYECGEIDELYESTGIKRIVKLYSYLNDAIKGRIVFIDELDANISGVFLDKLIDFIVESAKGQLCFTTHDILSMNTLKKYKNSIVTIGESGKVVPIVKNGNYSPVSQFYEGMIEDSPFNINSFDFLSAFDVEEY